MSKNKLGFLFSKFNLAILAIFLSSLVLRFWNLSQFNILVFDEVYYAKYANEYLIGKEFFQSHPPLSQYLIAISIWIGSHFTADPETINNLTGSLRSTFSYRWLNALTGSFIPLIVGAITYQLTQRKTVSLIATLLGSLDGLFLVESRYALNNIYLILFGLLGQLFFLLALQKDKKINCLLLSGICFGLSANIKWNGLGFLLGIFIFIGMAWLIKIFNQEQEKDNLWTKVTNLRLETIFITLIVFPVVTYSLLWIPHLLVNHQYNFLQVHQAILSFHQRIQGNQSDAHPYCSPWYSWLVMWRPIAYYFQKDDGKIYDVHAMGNPLLWWLSTGAMLRVCWRLFNRQDRVIAIYILSNYIANLLPWLKISRCTFLYHYMASYTFTWIALAWLLADGLQSSLPSYRITSKVAIILIIIAFIYWLPIYLGIPLSLRDYYLRMIFPNWI
jgi:dolichyl-phosphate-mannose-protein mannosyltransferase